MLGTAFPPALPRKLGLRGGFVEEAEEGEVLGEIRLDRLHATAGPVLDPGGREILFDPVHLAAVVHGSMIDPGADDRMSRMAHFGCRRCPGTWARYKDAP